jgi:signal transduction histidine kinase
MRFATSHVTPGSGESSAQPNVESIVRNLAHDLRQPLSAIESIAFYLDMMIDESDSKTRKQVNRLRRLVQQTNLVVCNAIHSIGGAALTLAVMDLGELVAEAATDWASETGSRVTLVRPNQVRQQLLDGQQISLALANVFSFLPRGGSVFVTVSATLDVSAVEIEAAELRPPESDSLALLATQRIVEQHGGTIEFSDSVFIRLPLRF